MIRETAGQWRVFLICLAFGAAIGVIYDIGFIIRRGMGNSVIFNFIVDVAFFVAAAVIIVFSAGFLQYGAVHFYMAAAYILGFLIQRLTLGKLVAKFSNSIYNVLKGILK